MPGKACNKYSGKKKQDCLNYKGEFAKMKGTQKPIQTKQEESDLMGLPAAQNDRTVRRNKRNAAKKY